MCVCVWMCVCDIPAVALRVPLSFTDTLLIIYYSHTVSEEMCVIPPVDLRVQLRIARSSAGFLVHKHKY